MSFWIASLQPNRMVGSYKVGTDKSGRFETYPVVTITSMNLLTIMKVEAS